ncbi:transcription factor LBX1a [Salarias fasciatus]|uniref:Transcription factor LBX1-like n=1 Tax=Salarias fasciatus TaxID=181472 RepID=A0A672ID79_SALFA|nr:transcription factor LBX1-like [Salarias fasciatus]
MASPDPSGPEDRLPPPAGSGKPLTPFSIRDILSKPSVRRSGDAQPAPVPGLEHTSPLCALEELASKTFRGLEVSVLQAAEGRNCASLFGQKSAPKKRRKSRTAFTNHQILELEQRFRYQKYLSPADRDRIAQQLALTNAQVITWFQNRRAKLKRDLEEMRADVESARAQAGGGGGDGRAGGLAELERSAAGDRDRDRSPSRPPVSSHSPVRPQPSSVSCSEEEEEEEEEIHVDD